MSDTLTPAERSKRMSRVKGRNTAPEMLVRRIVHGSDTATACTGVIFPAARI
jgi:G:T-mismatch repair DNA endonuclease (very short patch repair protein)